MTDKRFDFRFTTAYRIAGLPFGVVPSTCDVLCENGRMSVKFGVWRLRTALENVADASITGPYAYLKTAGPAHLSVSDRGLTFATNGERGVCIEFRTPVGGIEPTGRLRHPSLTVTVADCDGLAAVLRQDA